MAKITEQVALIVGEQSAEGTINAAVRDATAVTATNGVLFIDDSLEFDLERFESDPQVVPGSFTVLPGELIERRVAAFSFDVVLKGSGKTLTPADGDHDLPAPIVDLLEGAGLIDSASDANSTSYTLAATCKFLTFKLWRGAQSWTLQDCHTALSIEFTPGERTVMTVTVFAGAITHNAADTFPTSIAYGTQVSNIAPVLRSAGAAIGGVTRGFLSATLELSPEFEEFPDSNASRGVVSEQQGRSVTLKGQWYADSSDIDQDWENLGKTSSFPDVTFRLGAADADPSNSLLFTITDLDVTKQTYAREAGRVVFELEGRATNSTANAELSLSSS